jgi:hypothetical protein
MDETQLVDWYDVVEAVANGHTAGHTCPACEQATLEAQLDGPDVTLRCPECTMGFKGRLGAGRDDSFYAQAIEMERRSAARRVAPMPAQAAPTATVVEATPEAEPRVTDPMKQRLPPPWEWKLPSQRAEPDPESLSLWMEVAEAIHNGRRTGLRCPMCSEPLDGIKHQPPYVRVTCTQCGEGFEGRLG